MANSDDSGGEEVMLDVAGQDATEAFEDVGHSDEARETLDQLLVGNLKRGANDPVPKSPAVNSSTSNNKADQTTGGIAVYAVILIGGLAAYFAYNYMQEQQSS